MKTVNVECVIVGAGFAGIATAYRLTEQGISDVVILEKEKIPGFHSSGRNAGMIRQINFDPQIARMAVAGASYVRSQAPSESFHLTGSILLGGKTGWPRLRKARSEFSDSGLPIEEVEEVKPDLARSRWPDTAGSDFLGALYTSSDGVVDPHALLSDYLRKAQAGGARLFPDCEVERIEHNRNSTLSVRTASFEFRARHVVNASGAWASEVGKLARAFPVPLVPYRRHLFHTGILEPKRKPGPFIWDEENSIYLRPESGGLLLSACDASLSRPGVPTVAEDAAVMLATKLAAAFPVHVDLPVARSWAGLRTFAPDQRFVIGPDPIVPGFYWVAGLGGHGVTVSAAAGALAAKTILEPVQDRQNPFSPSRFAKSGQATA